MEHIEYHLRHGIILRITGDTGDDLIGMATEFLADAMCHFRPLLKAARQDRYAGVGFQRAFAIDRADRPADFVLLREGEPVTNAEWWAAVSWAYAAADTLAGVVGNVEVFVADAEGDDGMAWAVKALARGDHAQALRFAFATAESM